MGRIRILTVFLIAVLLTACSKNPQEASVPMVSTTAGANLETAEAGLPAGTAEAGLPAGTAEAPVEEESEDETSGDETSEDETPSGEAVMQIQVRGNGHTIVFELNNSPASRSLYSQLPLTLEVEDYGSNEKIFYPPDELEIGDTPLTEGGGEGGLAYFAPWGDVIMYYDSFGPYSGLYDLGAAVSGGEWIEELSGEVLIELAETSF